MKQRVNVNSLKLSFYVNFSTLHYRSGQISFGLTKEPLIRPVSMPAIRRVESSTGSPRSQPVPVPSQRQTYVYMQQERLRRNSEGINQR